MVQYDTLLFVCCLWLLQWWMGRPLWSCWGIRAGSGGRNHHKAAVAGGEDLRRLLSETASGHQHQKPLVLRVLAVPLPVPPGRTPPGEQELQESLLRWVKTQIVACGLKGGKNEEENEAPIIINAFFFLFSSLNVLSSCFQKVTTVNCSQTESHWS